MNIWYCLCMEKWNNTREIKFSMSILNICTTKKNSNPTIKTKILEKIKFSEGLKLR